MITSQNPEVLFWTLQATCQIGGHKALMPPLGLITVAALLPREWDFRFVELNTQAVSESDWDWVETGMVSGMIVQQANQIRLIREAKARGKTVVVGGPCVSSLPEPALEAGADCVVRGEAEAVIPQLLEALQKQDGPHVIEAAEKPAITPSPVPRFDLLRLRDYAGMAVQTSRGCPFDCEFCDIVHLYGRHPRYKTPDQVLAELEALHRLGWRGLVFLSDDNFIGNKPHARSILDRLTPWMKSRDEPFCFWTQASLNLSADLDLIDKMTAANFSHVFIGVESPDEETLRLNRKLQNIHNPPLESLRTITRNGLCVIASFVVSFDNERPGAGRRICEFVEAADLPLVALNVLHVLPNTRLWDRLEKEGRLFKDRTHGDTMAGKLNYVPTRPATEIMGEFADAWNHLYEPSRYLARALRYCLAIRPTRFAQAVARGERPPAPRVARKTCWSDKLRPLRQFLSLVRAQGIWPPLSAQFWKQCIEMRKRNPSRLVAYLGFCDLGQNMFDLTPEINRRVKPGRGNPGDGAKTPSA
jgi:radical SAM superfamily enzyme YgiQ (UPF0313 family)